MLLVDTVTTRKHLAFPPLIAKLRELFKEGCVVPLRHTHVIPPDNGTFLIMPAWRVGKKLGIKTVSIYPGNVALKKPGLHSVYTLFDATTGEPLCQMDGNEITSRRTVSASALAASFLAREDAEKLLICGAGRVASLTFYAMSVVRRIKQVEVWDISKEMRDNLVSELRGANPNVVVRGIDDLEAGVRRADIISCATLSRQPLVRGEWLRPGQHLDLIGSFTPEMVETDPECFRRANVYVDTNEALMKSGDVLNAIKAGKFNAEKDCKGTLESLCRGQAQGRSQERAREEITLFKSVGTALEDLAAGELVYDGVMAEKKEKKAKL